MRRGLVLLAAAAVIAAPASAVAQRCGKIEAWEASAAPLLKTKTPNSYAGPYQELVPYFRSDEFVAMAGKPFEKLSYAKRTDLAKRIAKCSKNSYVRMNFTHPLWAQEGSKDHQTMVRLLNEPEAPPVAVAAAPEPTPRPAPVAQPTPRPAVVASAPEPVKLPSPVLHWRGDLIAETPTARVYHRRIRESDRPSGCYPNKTLSIVFRPGPDGDVDFRHSAMHRLIAEITPAIKRICGKARRIEANLFVEDFYLAFPKGDQEGPQLTTRAAIENREVNEDRIAMMTSALGDTSDLRIWSMATLKNPDGSAVRPALELLTFKGYRAAMARGFTVQDPFVAQAAAGDLAARQRALIGTTIDNEAVWAALEGGDFTYSTVSLLDKTRKMSDIVAVIGEAYGLSVVRRCDDRVVGGSYVKTFKIGRQSTGEVQQQHDFTLVKDLGKAAYNGRTGDQVTLFWRWEHIFSEEAREGSYREAMDTVIGETECLSPVHRRLHANVLQLLDHHGLR